MSIKRKVRDRTLATLVVLLFAGAVGGCGPTAPPGESPNVDVGIATDTGSDDDRSADGSGMDAPPDVVCGEPGDFILFHHELHDLEGCTIYRGTIGLSDHPGDGFLRKLSSLRVIEGDFSLFRNRELTSLDGLQNLERVGGDFRVRWSGKLENLAEAKPERARWPGRGDHIR